MYKSSTSLSTTSFHVLLDLPLCLAPSTSKHTTHSFTQSSSSFLKICPHHHNRFLWITFTVSFYSKLLPYSMQDSLSLNFRPRIHLNIFISIRCNASSCSFSIFDDHVSLLCNMHLCTHASQTFPRNSEEASFRGCEEKGQ